MSPARIRPEREADREAIRALTVGAFGQAAEADLVDALRAQGDLVLSLVAADPAIVGHLAFSRLGLPRAAVRATALAPVSAAPSRQRQGIGTALIRDGLRRLAADGEDLVLVLGEPAFYNRFGFAADAARGLSTPYDGPYLQALAFTEAGRAASGPVRYAAAFADLG